MYLDQPISDSKLLAIIEKVLKQRGLDLNRYKISFLKRRLEIRMKSRGIADYSQYASLLNSDPSELSELFQSLSINVTQFFRDPLVYQKFSDVIVSKILSEANPFDKIRIWSAGCASGEEPYSIATLFRNMLGNKKSPTIEITASDVSKKAIDFAKAGIYPSLAFKNVPQDIVSKYFRPVKDDGGISVQYEVLPEIKQLINFKVEDILSNSLQSYDVIFCRNVLIYYTKEAHDLIFTKFHNSMKKFGHLIIGMDETMLGTKAEKLFSFVSIKDRIYTRNN